MDLIPNFVGVHMIGAIFALSKMHKPRGLTVPITLPFAQHLELLAPVRMENERERRKTLARDLVRIPLERKLFGSIFVNIQNARARLRDGRNVRYICAFPWNRDAVIIQALMEQILDRGKAIDVAHQFLHPLARFLNHLL